MKFPDSKFLDFIMALSSGFPRAPTGQFYPRKPFDSRLPENTSCNCGPLPAGWRQLNISILPVLSPPFLTGPSPFNYLFPKSSLVY